MVAQGGVATSICDCSISVITLSPMAFRARAGGPRAARRTARRVRASNTKNSSSMPIVYMRAQTPGAGTRFHPGRAMQNGRRGKTAAAVGLRLRPYDAGSALVLAAAGGADVLLQLRQADRADHDLVADHVARRAVQAQRLGELEVLLERRLHLGA